MPLAKWEGSNLETPGQAEQLPYSDQQPELADFAAWLSQLERVEKYGTFTAHFMALNQLLQVVADYETRRALLAGLRAVDARF